MSFPIPSFAPFLCSSAKVVHLPLKVERSGRQAVSGRIFLLRRVFTPKPFPFQCLYSEMQTATEMND